MTLHIIKWASIFAMAIWMSIPAAVITLMVFILIDFVTGLASAFVRKEVDSSVGVRGGVKKSLIVALVLAIHYAEGSFGVEMHAERFLSAYFIVIEIISIVENCSRAGIQPPVVLVEALIKVRSLYPRTMTAGEVEEAFKNYQTHRQSQINDKMEE